MRRRALFCVTILGCLNWSMLSQTQLRAQDDVRFFESKIRPVLVKHCYEYHSTESGKARGGLKVDSREALQSGGDSGPAVVAKSLNESELYQALLYHDDGWQMPPKGKLPQTTIDDFRRWILMGAPDPRVTAINPNVASAIDIEAGRQFWAYQPLSPTLPPATATEWPTTAIDRFVEVKLQAQGLNPVDDASPQVLVRRLYFTLTGLPPSPEDLKTWSSRLRVSPFAPRKDEFSSQPFAERKAILAQLVDELLASDRYGERWGRHWMDVARFAESTGGDHNNI